MPSGVNTIDFYENFTVTAITANEVRVQLKATLFEVKADKDIPGGYAGLDSSSRVGDSDKLDGYHYSQISDEITTVAASVTTHEGASDAHPGYMTADEHTSVGDGTPHHQAVTLTAAADAILGLSTQQVDVDVQAANTVLAGPESGDAAAPTARALVDADIPGTIARTGDFAPTDAKYLVGEADGDLPNAIVAGLTPNGEVYNAWNDIKVATTHAGSAHHSHGITVTEVRIPGGTGLPHGYFYHIP